MIRVRSPVRELLQVHLLVTVEELADLAMQHPHEEGDEDDGQHHRSNPRDKMKDRVLSTKPQPGTSI